MIVVKLIGGLGNQLFQYATGRALAHHHKTDLLLDNSFLEIDPKGAYTKRKYELDAFKINAGIADKAALSTFNFDENKLVTKLKKITPGLFDKMIFNEHQFNFHPEFLKLPTSTYLNGYWQSENYFRKIRKELLQELSLRDPFSDAAKNINNKINTVNAVSLHIRRGDFVDLKSASHFHGSLETGYYKQAVDLITQKNKDAVFFIFSDDIDWCKANLGFIKEKEFVDGRNNSVLTQEELILMSCCKHNIIANSSFSWWGAWLNQNRHKQVIAPKNWFADKKINTNDLIPADWIRI